MVLFLERCIIVSRYPMGPTSKNIEALRMLCEGNVARIKLTLKPAVCFIALFFAISFSCPASDNSCDLKDRYIGFKAGITYPQSQLTVNTDFIDYPADPALGFTGGLSVNYYFIKNLLAAQLEVNFTMIRTTEKFYSWDQDANLTSVGTMTTTWDSIEIPLLAKLSAPWNLRIKPYITAGPALVVQFRRSIDFDPQIYYNSKTLLRGSLIGGIGADYILDNGNSVSLEVRADWKMVEQTTTGYGVVPFTFFTVFAGYSM